MSKYTASNLFSTGGRSTLQKAEDSIMRLQGLMSKIGERQQERRRYFLQLLDKHAKEAQRRGLRIGARTLQVIEDQRLLSEKRS